MPLLLSLGVSVRIPILADDGCYPLPSSTALAYHGRVRTFLSPTEAELRLPYAGLEYTIIWVFVQELIQN